MFGKKFSGKIKLVFTILTISLFLLQFFMLNNNCIENSVGTISGKVVAFEESHNPSTNVELSNPCSGPPDRYGSFVEQLTNNSFTIETIDVGDEINQTTLQQIDIIVIAVSHTSYTTQEITEIDNWVKNGGSLLLITDYGSAGNNMGNYSACSTHLKAVVNS